MHTWQTIDTEYSADSAEFCPLAGLQDVLAVGTYQLREAEQQSRVGRLYLYQLQGVGGEPSLVEMQRIECDAILDMKWSHQLHNDRALLGIAKSTGHISFHHLSVADRHMQDLCRFDLDDPATLVLSLDWRNRRGGDPACVVSNSDGTVALLDVSSDNGGSVKQVQSWTAHDAEAWITAFDYWDTWRVYSGGDDMRLKAWDVRTDCTSAALVSKAYDDRILVWDTRAMRSPLHDISTGGGVWRLKWHPSADRGNTLMAACMYNGFHVFDVGQHNGEPACSYMEHKSIAYGVDWCYDARAPELLASCSFYDHTLRLWNM
ncbi:hypothetical protein RI367_006195 [Sorochytrium milnesiophthora]